MLDFCFWVPDKRIIQQVNILLILVFKIIFVTLHISFLVRAMHENVKMCPLKDPQCSILQF